MKSQMVVRQMSYFSKEIVSGSVFHQSEAEPLLSEILDGGPDQIDFIVNDQKTVMSFGEYAHFYRRILCIMLPRLSIRVRTVSSI